MRFINIEEVNNGWILSLTVPGTAHEVRRVYTAGDAMQRCVNRWLEDSVEESLSDDKPEEYH